MNELSVMMDLSREVRVVLPRRFKHDLWLAVSNEASRLRVFSICLCAVRQVMSREIDFSKRSLPNKFIERVVSNMSKVWREEFSSGGSSSDLNFCKKDLGNLLEEF
jgi:hypothetical protein